jgi:hypothetical protein
MAELIVATEAPELDARFWTDSESDAFLAHSGDRTVLDDLAARLRTVAADEARLRRLMDLATSRGHAFDD